MNIGFLNLLTLVFVIAKLFGAISWSWWIVLIPTFISVGIAVTVFGFVFLAAFLKEYKK